MTQSWMLPDGVDEWLAPASWKQEELRRALLDEFRANKYELILTPLLEHLDTLLIGAGSDLEEQTFKLVDPVSGKTLGLRADMTPQAARIAARRFADKETVRLCYLGTVLRSKPAALGGPRAPRQVGCELFGDASLDADLEILALMLKTLEIAGVKKPHLDLSHVGVYRDVLKQITLSEAEELNLFSILQRKSFPDLQEFVNRLGIAADIALHLKQLMNLNGDASVIQRARDEFKFLSDDGAAALNQLDEVVAAIEKQHSDVPVHIDLAELRGYRYKTGLVYAAFVAGHGRELARGGRYDGIGEQYGTARPATGFSADITELMRLQASAEL